MSVRTTPRIAAAARPATAPAWRRRAAAALAVLLVAAGTVGIFWPQISGLLYQRAQRNLRAVLGDAGTRPLPGDAWGRIVIPSIGLDAVVVEGVSEAHLRKGPGHYPQTGRPGDPGLVGIAGHRTTFGAPFRHIDRLEPGDLVELHMPGGRFTYRVDREPWAISPRDWDALASRGPGLVLTSCHPPGSARQRIVAHAVLT